MQIITVLFCLTALLSTSGCIANVISATVQSGLVFAVAKHDEKTQKKKKRYTALDKCIIEGTPEAYTLGNEMLELNGRNTVKYDQILSRSVDKIDPAKPEHLAYAFYIIADELRDNRAKEQIKTIERKVAPKEALEVRSLIEDKYLVSYLDKCFTVPESYKITKTTRELILEQQVN